MSLRKKVSDLNNRVYLLENLVIRLSNESGHHAVRNKDSFGTYWNLKPLSSGTERAKLQALLTHLGLRFSMPMASPKLELIKKEKKRATKSTK